jgi:hypothetical protein
VASNGDVGTWHETYRVRPGDMESIYNNMPPFGLGRATREVPAKGARVRARPDVADSASGHREDAGESDVRSGCLAGRGLTS